MKVNYIAVNAKYIHTNSAVRILHQLSCKSYDSIFLEFTIKDSIDYIIGKILDNTPDVIGFSCYLWNIEIIIKVCKLIKIKQPNIKIILGGPEVSYDTKNFIKFNFIDYIIAGDGEVTILKLLSSIKNNQPINLDSVATKDNPYAKPKYIDSFLEVPSIIDLYSEDDIKNKIIYLETSRGCPFNCSYCLSSVESNKIRYLPLEDVFSQIDYFINRNARNIKFLDRTSNANEERFLKIIQYIEGKNCNQVFQFEVEANILSNKMIDYLSNNVKKGLIRLEIGIQSTNELSNKSVNRISNIPKLFNTIKTIQNGERVTIHVDLIAGLPYEDINSFIKSFNETFKLYCAEFQLGFLKLLRGTPIKLEAYVYDYEFDSLPPYEIISNKYLSKFDLLRIKDCEEGLERFWNSFRAQKTIKKVIENNEINPFIFFEGLGKLILKDVRYQENDFYLILSNYLLSLGINEVDLLKEEYLRRYKIRPIRFWGLEKIKPSVLKKEIQGKKLISNKYLQNAFVTSITGGYLIITYVNNESRLLKVVNNKLEEI
ncbi:MAG: radical SAM protein [Bacilli bacterium]|nr:radical SAM protein [Bacilli bacterium]